MKNVYNARDDYIEIECFRLGVKYLVVIDIDSLVLLNKYNTFYINSNGYAVTDIYNSLSKKKEHIYLHHIVLSLQNAIKGLKDRVDHINRNKLDNRKANLRLVSNSINVHNKPCKGYYKRKLKDGYVYSANITINGERIHIGNYGTEERAKKAYEDYKQKHLK